MEIITKGIASILVAVAVYNYATGDNDWNAPTRWLASHAGSAAAFGLSWTSITLIQRILTRVRI